LTKLVQTPYSMPCIEIPRDLPYNVSLSLGCIGSHTARLSGPGD
jgi:hypothetical protein